MDAAVRLFGLLRPEERVQAREAVIKSRVDYLAYLEADRIALGIADTWKTRLTHEVWAFQRALRRLEYLRNCGGARPLVALAWWRHRRLSIALGFTIPPNVFGPGLSIAHRGTIVVNSKARVGANCRIHVCVNIGEGSDGRAPVIGDDCYLAPGAKLFGAIVLGPGVKVGANAVVNRSFPDGHVAIGGIPAKVLGAHAREEIAGEVSLSA